VIESQVQGQSQGQTQSQPGGQPQGRAQGQCYTFYIRDVGVIVGLHIGLRGHWPQGQGHVNCNILVHICIIVPTEG
jgi:hypothetical protein